MTIHDYTPDTTVFDARDLVGLPPEDQVQCEIAAADAQFHELYGRDESTWLPWQRTAYRIAMTELCTTSPEEGTAMSMPVTGPHRVYVRRTPSGVALNLSAYLDYALRHLAEEHPDELVELVEAADAASVQTSHGSEEGPAVHERDALAQQLADAVPELDVYGAQAAALAAQIAPEVEVATAEVRRLRAESRQLREVIRSLEQQRAELQRANEATYREEYDRSGGPRMGDGEHAMAWPPKSGTYATHGWRGPEHVDSASSARSEAGAA